MQSITITINNTKSWFETLVVLKSELTTCVVTVLHWLITIMIQVWVHIVPKLRTLDGFCGIYCINGIQTYCENRVCKQFHHFWIFFWHPFSLCDFLNCKWLDRTLLAIAFHFVLSLSYIIIVVPLHKITRFTVIIMGVV